MNKFALKSKEMMNKVLQGITIVMVVIFMTGCSGIKAPELQTVEIVDLSREAGEGILQVNLTYTNVNKADLKTKIVNIEGMINQKSLGSFEERERMTFPGKEDKVVEVIYHFQPDDIYPGFLSKQFGAIGSKRVRITLNGSIEFIKADKSVEVPVDYSEVYKIPG